MMYQTCSTWMDVDSNLVSKIGRQLLLLVGIVISCNIHICFLHLVHQRLELRIVRLGHDFGLLVSLSYNGE
jgi:hypothetical protein